MKELSVTVTFPGTPEATYRFREFPVRIGRLPECHLSICHESVPRDLCLVWLEDEGRTVRVEERPGLTNPLFVGRSLVAGGLSGDVVDLAVGPVKLKLASVERLADSKASGKGRQSWFQIIVALGLVVLGISVFFGHGVGQKTDSDMSEMLPDEPFCGPAKETCRSKEACDERARILVSRGRELLSRPGFSPSDQVRAAIFLERGARFYAAAGAPVTSSIQREADEAKGKVASAYKRDVMKLRRSLREDATAVARVNAARRVSSYLVECAGPGRRRLERFLEKTRK
ncbi:MAG: hypothetical protein GY854_05325 [Deltaproteobacteria bacterium]|nr:hypothetical protein [Deltaproteobacteria bacterium]